MTTELYAGTLAHFDDSMAKDIEDQLALLMGPLPAEPKQLVDGRHALLIAIAQGVINHLQHNQAALEITCDLGGVRVTTHPNIQVKR